MLPTELEQLPNCRRKIITYNDTNDNCKYFFIIIFNIEKTTFTIAV